LKANRAAGIAEAEVAMLARELKEERRKTAEREACGYGGDSATVTVTI